VSPLLRIIDIGCVLPSVWGVGQRRESRPTHALHARTPISDRGSCHHWAVTTLNDNLPPASRRTRLVATVGPASIGIIDRLVEVGLDVARINFSHGSASEHLHAAQAIREAAARAGRTVGILVDLPGPKLRLAQLHADPVELETGATVTLTGPGIAASDASLPLGDATLPSMLRVGDRILLADGAAELRVTGSRNDTAIAEVVRGGLVRSRQGVSVPAQRLAADALGRADEAVIPHLLSIRSSRWPTPSWWPGATSA